MVCEELFRNLAERSRKKIWFGERASQFGLEIRGRISLIGKKKCHGQIRVKTRT